MGRVGVVATRPAKGNPLIVAGWRALGLDAALLDPDEALATLAAGDCALGRIDVRPTLDGVEPGLEALDALERHGVRVFNRSAALLASHDKLATAAALERAGVPHPALVHVEALADVPLAPPFVVKPRFGSWGRDVFLCGGAEDAERLARTLSGLRWFRRDGAIVQELVPPVGHDLRVLVAGGRVVGVGRRHAAAGEWRTNVSLGGSSEPADAPAEVTRLALAAADAIGGDFMGVDLLPTPGGGHVVLEVNGAVDFDERYSLPGRDVFADAAGALGLLGVAAGADAR